MKNKKLEKQLGLFDIFAISTGAMFSSGFFLLPGIAAAQTGASVYLSYFASGLLIIPAMLCVAELSTAMPKAGGAYYFLDRSMGPMVGTIGGLGSWIALMFKSAFALIGMGAYLSLYIDISFTLLALILTVCFGILNIFGAKETTLLQRILVATLVVIMGFFVVQGLSSISLLSIDGTPEEYKNFFRGDLHGFISTIGLVFVSYAGLTKVASVAEEVQNPDRNIPLGMFLSLFTAIAIYVLGVYVMLKVLDPQDFYNSLTPVADAGAQFLDWLPGSAGVVAVVIAAVAAFASTGNAGIMSASRYPFAMARDKLVSSRFAKLGKTGTPTFSILVTVGCMIVILLTFDVQAVAKLASAFQLLLFAMLCFAVIVMRESNIAAYSPGFRAPLYPWMPLMGMVISVWLIAEMGLIAVGFTGMIIVFCVGWYFYYGSKLVSRRGAIFHVHERLGRQRYDALEHELLSILNEKQDEKNLMYEQVIARSQILSISDPQTSFDSLMDQASDLLGKSIKTDKERIRRDLFDRVPDQHIKLGNGVILSTFHYDEVEQPEMMVIRIPENLQLSNRLEEGPIHALVILITPSNIDGLDIRLAGHLADIIQSPHFLEEWKQAESEKKLRQLLISDEHLQHIRAEDHPFFKQYLGQRLKDIPLPGEALIALIYRDGELVIPHGKTILKSADELTVIGHPADIKELSDPLS